MERVIKLGPEVVRARLTIAAIKPSAIKINAMEANNNQFGRPVVSG